MDPIARARELRRAMTDAERKLWRVLRNRTIGAKFRRQEPIGPYIVDFVCVDARLIVELDGGQHAESATDPVRDAFLADQGYRVMRVWNHEALRNTEGVITAIRLALGRD